MKTLTLSGTVISNFTQIDFVRVGRFKNRESVSIKLFALVFLTLELFIRKRQFYSKGLNGVIKRSLFSNTNKRPAHSVKEKRTSNS